MNIVDVIDNLPTNKDKKYPKRLISEIKYNVVHHSLTDDIPGDEDIYAFARYHVNHYDWPGIGYHYVIDTDGTIYKTNYISTKAYHAGDYNRISIGVCLVGNFIKYNPSDKQYSSLIELLKHLEETYNSKTIGHSEVPGYEWKECPAIDLDKLRQDLKPQEKQKNLVSFILDLIHKIFEQF